MSDIEETVESVQVNEDKEFDVEVEEHIEDEFAVDPTRYIFYKYCLVITFSLGG